MPRKFTPTTTHRTALYVRVSSRGQEDGASLSTQLTACDALGQDNGWDVLPAHVYRETFTGVELWERPELTRLRAAIAHGELDHVICYAIDRLSRDPVHLGVILSEADHHGVSISFVTETVDGTPEGQLIQFVRGYAAKVEHEKIRERTTRGKLARTTSGKPLAGPRALFGYAWRDDAKTGYTIDPIHRLTVERVYHEYASGRSLRQIGAALMADGVLTPTGKTNWTTGALRFILKHPAYTGRAYAWGWHAPEGQERHFDLDRAVELPAGTVPRLIDDAMFERVQERLIENRHGAGCTSRIPDGAVLLRGQVTCGICGSRMALRKYHHQPTDAPVGATPLYAYRCYGKHPDGTPCGSTSIRAAELDAAAWEAVLSILTKPDRIRRGLDMLGTDDAVQRDLDAVDAALRDIEQRQTNLAGVAALISNPEGRRPLAMQLEELGQRAVQLTEERGVILGRRQAWESSRTLLDEFQNWGATVAANAERFAWTKRRALVELLNVRAVVNPKRAEQRYEITSDFPLTVGTSEVNTSRRASVHFLHVRLSFAPADLAAA